MMYRDMGNVLFIIKMMVGKIFKVMIGFEWKKEIKDINF